MLEAIRRNERPILWLVVALFCFGGALTVDTSGYSAPLAWYVTGFVFLGLAVNTFLPIGFWTGVILVIALLAETVCKIAMIFLACGVALSGPPDFVFYLILSSIGWCLFRGIRGWIEEKGRYRLP